MCFCASNAADDAKLPCACIDKSCHMKCLMEWIGANGALTCPFCRAACASIIPLTAPIVAKSAARKRKRAQQEVDADDPEFEVSYLTGIRVSDDREVSYKVVWKRAEFRAGKQQTSWEHVSNLGAGVKVKEFHERYLIPVSYTHLTLPTKRIV